MPQSRGSGASSRSIWLRCGSPRWSRRILRAVVHPECSRSADVIASRPTSRRLSPISPIALDRLRRHRAGIGDHRFTIFAGFAQPIGAVGNGFLQVRRHHPLRLLERAGRKPQIDRAALARSLALHVLEPPAHDDRELIDKGRFERAEAILRPCPSRASAID